MKPYEPLEIFAIKTDTFIALADKSDLERNMYNDGSKLLGYLFDGKKPEKTFGKAWVSLDSMPTKCQKIIPEKSVIIGYKLKPEFSATEATPKEVPTEFMTGDSPGTSYWALYDAIEEVTPEHYEDTEFTITVLASVENFDMLRGFEYTVRHGQYPESNPKYTINQDSAQHQIIDKIVFPSILLPTRPCKLSSYESYQIIRNHIKDNIDGRYAEITSDFDFCLTVSKRISLTEPIPYQQDISRTKKPKLVTKYQHRRQVKVYEIAPLRGGEVYKGYPMCPEFEGANYRELEQNIKSYCDEIIAEINKPLVDCPCCKGAGVVIDNP
jgi:hypothetical protein